MLRRTFLSGVGGAAFAGSAMSASSRAARSPFGGGDRSLYCLLDETLVAQTFAMRREVAPPVDISEEPLIHPAWAYGTVLPKRSGGFRMWYLSLPMYCEYYAESEDGIRWSKPDLGLVRDVGETGPNGFLRAKTGRLSSA